MKKLLLIIVAVLLLAGSGLAAGGRETFRRNISYDNANIVNVEIDFGTGELSVARARGDFIARIKGDYDSDRFKIEVNYNKKGDEGFLKVKVDNKRSLFKLKSGKNHNEWEILLGDMVPMNINLDAGAADVNCDFSGLNISGLKMDVGMSSGIVKFNKPNKGHIDRFIIDAGQSSLQCMGLCNANFDRLVVDAGMASVNLGFSGKLTFDAKVDLDVGMGSADITLNSDAGTRIRAEDNWTSSIDFPNGFNKIKDGIYESNNYNSARGHLDFDIDAGMGSVDFEFAESL